MVLTLAKNRRTALVWPAPVPCDGDEEPVVVALVVVLDDAVVLDCVPVLVTGSVLDDGLVADDTDPLCDGAAVELLEWPPPHALRTTAATSAPLAALRPRGDAETKPRLSDQLCELGTDSGRRRTSRDGDLVGARQRRLVVVELSCEA